MCTRSATSFGMSLLGDTIKEMKVRNAEKKRIKKILLLLAVKELFTVSLQLEKSRNSAIFRKRWDSDYLLNLAYNEGSFIAEYRLTPTKFGILVDLLTPQLQRSDKFSALAMSTSKRYNTLRSPLQ